jgi:hypothetical protein
LTWNPWTRETRVLHSSLAPESCRERLRAETGSLWNPFSAWNRPVRGRVTEKGFWILKSIRYRNSFQTEASGRWLPEGNGTRIEMSLGMNRWVAVFMTLWLVGVFAFSAAWWLSGAASEEAPRSTTPWVASFLPLVMLAFGFGVIAFGRWLARNEARELIDFLSRIFECPPDATPIT